MLTSKTTATEDPSDERNPSQRVDFEAGEDNVVRVKDHKGAGKAFPDIKTGLVKLEFVKFNSFVADIKLSNGRYYYELRIIDLNGDLACAQLGWMTEGFQATNVPLRGEGVGDDNYSWGFDGIRQKKWGFSGDKAFGSKWKPGDVLGFAADMSGSLASLRFSVNGSFDHPNGLAFEGLQVKYLTPALSAYGVFQLNFGAYPFAHGPPDLLYKSVHERGKELQLAEALANAAGRNDLISINELLDSGVFINEVDNQYGRTALMKAASCNKSEAVLLLIQRRAALNILDENGESALHLAAARGYYNIMKLLIDRGAAIDSQDKSGLTPLMKAVCKREAAGAEEAATFLQSSQIVTSALETEKTEVLSEFKELPSLPEEGNMESGEQNVELPRKRSHRTVALEDLVRLLIAKGADLTKQTRVGNLTAAELAIKFKSYSVAKLIFDGISSDSESNIRTREKIRLYCDAALRDGCEEGDVDKVCALVNEMNASVAALTKAGRSPLMITASSASANASQIAEFLLQRGADITVTDKDDRNTALEIAAFANSWDVVDKIVTSLASVKDNDKRKMSVQESLSKVLINACKKGQYETARLLLEKNKIDTNLRDSYGNAALFYAALHGYSDLFDLLLREAAEPQSATSNSFSVAMAACVGGSKKIVKIVVEAECDLNAKDEKGYTALMYLAENMEQYKREKDLKWIYEDVIDRGADIYAVALNDYNILMAACKGGCIELIDYLEDRGVTIKSKDELTTTMYAIKQGYNALATKLLDRQEKSLNEATARNYTALMAACENRNASMVCYLVDRHAKLNIQHEDTGYTALMYLAEVGGDEMKGMASLLLRSGAELDYKSRKTESAAVDVAVEINSKKLTLLKGSELDQLVTRQLEPTAIEIAVKFNNTKLFIEILETVDDLCLDSSNLKMIEFRNTHIMTLSFLNTIVDLHPEFAATYLLTSRMNLIPLDYEVKSPFIEKGESALRGFNGGEKIKDSIDFTRGKSLFEMWAEYAATLRGLNVVQTKAFQTPIPEMASLDALKLYVKLANVSKRSDFFDQESVQVAVDFAWQYYGRSYHLRITAVYGIFLIASSVCNYNFDYLNHGVDGTTGAGHALVIIVLCFNTYFTSVEYVQLMSRPAKYLLDFSNFFASLAYLFTYVGSLLRLLHGEDDLASASVLAVGTLFLWINLLYYLRPYRSASAVTRMLYVDSQYELRVFIFVLVFTLFGFSQALYLLCYDDESLPFGKADSAFLNAFVYMMGQADYGVFDGSASKYLGVLLIVTLIGVATIFLLNLLIAILGNAYNRIHRDMAIGFRLERIEVMLDQIHYNPPDCPKFVCCLKRFDDIGANIKAKEDKLRLHNMQQDILKLKSEMACQSDMLAVKESMAQVLAKLGDEKHNGIPTFDSLKKGDEVDLDSSGQIASVVPARATAAMCSVLSTLTYDFAVGPQTSGNYFEVTILEMGTGLIGVGVAVAKGYQLMGKGLGDMPNSFGYYNHGRFGANRTTDTWPRFGVGDIIGCGVSFPSKAIYYTRNGILLGIGFTDVPDDFPLRPAVCFYHLKKEQKVSINFGTSPFKYAGLDADVVLNTSSVNKRSGLQHVTTKGDMLKMSNDIQNSISHVLAVLGTKYDIAPAFDPLRIADELTLENNNQTMVLKGSHQGMARSVFCTVVYDFSRGPLESGNYFEVTIIKGGGKLIGIGLAHIDDFPLTGVYPGNVANSYAYYGDDGKKYGRNREVEDWPLFEEGDVIGCGLDFSGSFIFYTRNGRKLGIAFTDLEKLALCPILCCSGVFGASDHGIEVCINFGVQPFLYNGADVVVNATAVNKRNASMQVATKGDLEKQDYEISDVKKKLARVEKMLVLLASKLGVSDPVFNEPEPKLELIEQIHDSQYSEYDDVNVDEAASVTIKEDPEVIAVQNLRNVLVELLKTRVEVEAAAESEGVIAAV